MLHKVLYKQTVIITPDLIPYLKIYFTLTESFNTWT